MRSHSDTRARALDVERVLPHEVKDLLINDDLACIGGKGLRDAGLDMVKAICIVMVLIWHLQPVTRSMMHLGSTAGALGWLFFGFLYRYIAPLAMPAFICVSIMLFMKRSSVAKGYWKERLKRLIQLFIFWTSIQFIVYLLAGGRFPIPLATVVPDGGPALPYVGDSVFHFLFALIVCTGLATMFLRLPDRFKLIASAIIIILSCSNFVISSHYRVPMMAGEMDNYYIYVPIAYYTVKHQYRLPNLRVFFILGFFLALAYETNIVRSMVCPYARLSVVFGVLSLISLFLHMPVRRIPVVEFLSRYSLGIFALHKYWYLALIVLLVATKTGFHEGVLPESLILFPTTVTLTLLSAYLLGKTKLRGLVS